MRSRRTTWMIGGIGLIISGVIGVLGFSALGPGPLGFWSTTSDLIYAIAAGLLAVGVSSSASVVRRRPLGVAAILMFAVWPLIESLLYAVVAGSEPSPGILSTIGYLAILVPAATGLLAVTEVVRARAVPSPWHWAPAIAFAFQVFVWVVPQVGHASSGQQFDFLAAVSPLGVVAALAGSVGLGTVSVYLASQQRPPAIQVYRSH